MQHLEPGWTFLDLGAHVGYFSLIAARKGSPLVVGWALLLGGFAILAVERFAKPGPASGVAQLPARQALGVGLFQCVSMIPGVSRSGATIMGALAMGIERRTAAEFSFFLGIPTLMGAGAYSLLKQRDALHVGDLPLACLAVAVVHQRGAGERHAAVGVVLQLGRDQQRGAEIGGQPFDAGGKAGCAGSATGGTGGAEAVEMGGRSGSAMVTPSILGGAACRRAPVGWSAPGRIPGGRRPARCGDGWPARARATSRCLAAARTDCPAPRNC